MSIIEIYSEGQGETDPDCDPSFDSEVIRGKKPTAETSEVRNETNGRVHELVFTNTETGMSTVIYVLKKSVRE